MRRDPSACWSCGAYVRASRAATADRIRSGLCSVCYRKVVRRALAPPALITNCMHGALDDDTADESDYVRRLSDGVDLIRAAYNGDD